MRHLIQLTGNILDIIGLIFYKGYLKLRIFLIKRSKSSRPAQQKDQPLYLKASHIENEYNDDYDFWG